MKKTYYRIKLKLMSPLSIGSGDGFYTDNDVIKGSNGEPMIPATAIAGMLRAEFDKKFGKNESDKLFGDIKSGRNISAVTVYDGVFTNETVISVRDCVKLDEFKTAVKGAKFNFQVVEAGSELVTYLETESEDTRIEELLKSIKRFTLGAKTTRGYGQIEIIEIKKREFDLSFNDKNTEESKERVASWLEFVLFDDDAFNSGKESYINCSNDDLSDLIEVKLQVNGSPIIRRYTTDLLDDERGNPDFMQLTSKSKDGDVKPVIPGTSWAGAFRSHITALGRECGIDYIEDYVNYAFGNVPQNKKDDNGEQVDDQPDEITRSRIVFEESTIDDSEEKILTRTSINRFTGGSANKALFTERVYFGGETTLCIRIKDKLGETDAAEKVIIALLKMSISDLHRGYLAIGGQTSVGHGLFKVKSVIFKGCDITDEILSDNYVFGGENK